MKRVLATLALAMWISACTSSDTSPTPTPTTTTTIPGALVSLTGTVTATGGATVANAAVKILDGPNAGRLVLTNSTGGYSLTDLTIGNANVSANASIYDEVRNGLFINGTTTLNFMFPLPSCQTLNTGSVRFGNRSTTGTHDVVWDGSKIFTLAPGATSPAYTSSAGVAHTLAFNFANTNNNLCTESAVLAVCDRGGTFTCSIP